jgi:hypothetical protein
MKFLVAFLLLALTVYAEPPTAAVDRVRFQCPAGAQASFVGAKLEGSNVSRREGFTTLAEVKEAPAAPGWAELKLENPRVFRWYRFTLPETAPTKLGKVELYAGDRLLAGEGKGVNFVIFKPTGTQSDHAIGYDLFDSAVAQRVAIKPEATNLDAPADVTLHANPAAAIRYTLDGTWPTAEHGETYTAPLHVAKNTTISAVALLPERAPSLLQTATYLVKGETKPGLSTADIGNSLTGTTGGFWRFARTAGYDHHAAPFLRPGALTRELWALASGTFATDKVASSKEAQARKRGSASWEDYWAKIDKVDALTLQPRDFDLDKELAAEIAFIKLFRQKSPDLQPWLYCEWVEQKRDRPSDHGTVPSYEMTKTFPALTWEESMGAMLLYVEELQHRLGAQFHEGKAAHIIPSALAMGWIKNKIDHGQFGGAKPDSLYSLLFNDQVHPADAPIHGTANGAFLVDMTWFGALYRQSSEGKVLPIETNFTPEQVGIVQRLAWDVIKNYPDCGLYEAGTQPCGKPEFANDGKIITLKSATPGAWFRYTLDGTVPTRTRGYVYCGAISVQPGIAVKAIAYESGMADSEVAAP